MTPTSPTATQQAGSPGYFAPEILLGQEYGKPVDMWSLGVTAYLMFVGFLPWDDTLEQSVNQQIVEGNYSFQDPAWDHISVEAKDFVSACLTLDPSARMTASEALTHPLFSPSYSTIEAHPAEPTPPVDKPKESSSTLQVPEKSRSNSFRRGSFTPAPDANLVIALLLKKVATKKNTPHTPADTPKKSQTETRAKRRQRGDSEVSHTPFFSPIQNRTEPKTEREETKPIQSQENEPVSETPAATVQETKPEPVIPSVPLSPKEEPIPTPLPPKERTNPEPVISFPKEEKPEPVCSIPAQVAPKPSPKTRDETKPEPVRSSATPVPDEPTKPIVEKDVNQGVNLELEQQKKQMFALFLFLPLFFIFVGSHLSQRD